MGFTQLELETLAANERMYYMVVLAVLIVAFGIFSQIIIFLEKKDK